MPANREAATIRAAAPTAGASGATGAVLAGAAALGAYEAGVLRHVMTEVAREIGRPMPFDVLSGTSAGAINAAALAAFADAPAEGSRRLYDIWCALRLDALLRVSPSSRSCCAGSP
jgi:NTE family protein